MHRQTIMTAVAITLLNVMPSPAVAQLKYRSVERAIESNTETVPLPGSIPTSLSFKPCGTCKFVTLRVDESTRYFVGKAQVTLPDLRRYANRGSSNLDVFYDETDGLVTRIILRAEPDAADAARSKSTRQVSESPRTKQ